MILSKKIITLSKELTKEVRRYNSNLKLTINIEESKGSGYNIIKKLKFINGEKNK